MSRIQLSLILVTLLILCLLGGWYVLQPEHVNSLAPLLTGDGLYPVRPDGGLATNPPLNATIGSGLNMADLGNLVVRTTDSASLLSKEKIPSMAITSHHIPTAAPLIGRLYALLQKIREPAETVVIIGPDHYEICGQHIVTTTREYQTPFGSLASNSDLAQKLTIPILDQPSCFDNEHAIASQAAYIKHIWPSATIVPILLSAHTTPHELEHVEQILLQEKSIFILLSLDFNHYHTVNVADASDVLARQAIAHLDAGSITSAMLDSVPAIHLGLSMAKKQQLTATILENINSFLLTGIPDNTTSYMNVLFIR